MARTKQIEGKYIETKALKDTKGEMINKEMTHKEYFIRYDSGGTDQDSIQGVVIFASSAKIAIKVLSKEYAYIKLLRVERI